MSIETAGIIAELDGIGGELKGHAARLRRPDNWKPAEVAEWLHNDIKALQAASRRLDAYAEGEV